MVARGAASRSSFEEDLRQVGVEPEWLRTAVGDGNRERTRVLGNQHAMSAQGFYAWNGILASLTVSLEGSDWERRDPRSLPILINKTKRNLLFVSSGDQFTGITRTGIVPKSRNPKGVIVKELAQQNRELQRGDPLPLDIPEPAAQKFMKDVLGYTTYVLLVHFSRDDREARYEVSRLGDLDSGGRLAVQEPRMIAPAYQLMAEDFGDLDPNGGFDGLDEGFEGPGDYEVPPRS